MQAQPFFTILMPNFGQGEIHPNAFREMFAANFGTSLDDLLSSTVNNGHGPPPPASAEAIDSLEDCEGAAGAQCAICLEEYLPGQRGKRMPCGHAFHTDCLMPWLCKFNHTCPTCRRPVPAAAATAAARAAAAAPPPPVAPPAPPPPEDLSALSIRELKARLDQLSISYAGVLERSELEALLREGQRNRPRPEAQPGAPRAGVPFFAAANPFAVPFAGVHSGAPAMNPFGLHFAMQFASPTFAELVAHQEERMLQEALERSMREHY